MEGFLADFEAPPTGAEEPRREEPRIVYQDVDLAVVFKPSGWSSDAHPEAAKTPKDQQRVH